MMGRTKSWGEKLRCGRESKLAVLAKPFAGLPVGTRLFVPSPARVAEAVRALPPGTALTTRAFRERLAESERADAACPTTTAIALRVVAEAVLEELAAGAGRATVAPFWRAVSPADPLAAKLSCGVDALEKLRREERS